MRAGNSWSLRCDLSPRACALIVVDLQNDFCHPEAPIGRHVERHVVNGMCSTITEIRKVARIARVPVIWVRTVHRDATDSGPWLRRLAAGDPHVCREGSWGARFYKLVPDDLDVVVEKHRYSAFHGTELQHVLRRLRCSTVVVVGTATNVCVESTVRDACMNDHDTVVVADATCAATEDEHCAALVNISRYFGSVVDSAEVIRAWTVSDEDLGLHYLAESGRDLGNA